MLGERKAKELKMMKPNAFIDGAQIEYQPGERILDAAVRAGRVIPTLCHDPRLGSSGACRLCMVKIKGAAGPVPACERELQPGMRVITEDEELLEWRRAILKLALSENPRETCTACEQVEPCRLHALAQAHGVQSEAYIGRTSGSLEDDPNPFILRDYSQCILCYRCTQVCSELEAAQAIFPTGRGFESRISTSQANGLLESPCT
ncbi:MAG: 2Fe-2S iron-sulfur cluster-binding protein, partial [Anaerolineales bacterium]|nr:2Fe-2S iron-sulfur cluster-binding protein [Anaerolineales bacterium]